MALENFIYFNGNCKEAVEYYAEVFGLDKPQFMICKDVPGIPDFGLNWFVVYYPES